MFVDTKIHHIKTKKFKIVRKEGPLFYQRLGTNCLVWMFFLATA
ncbi:MAG: hypothetical protein ACJAYK_002446 [Crocinitomicaceae bacterium]|jgi:hypothetical protein